MIVARDQLAQLKVKLRLGQAFSPEECEWLLEQHESATRERSAPEFDCCCPCHEEDE